MLAVDQSLSCTGFAYRENGRLVHGNITPGKLRGSARLYYIRMKILALVERAKPSLFVLEDYVMGFRRGTGRLAHLGELGGTIKLALWESGIDVMIVPSATLKSVVAGDGKADKSKIQSSLRKKYGYDVRQEDEADAVALLLIGESRCGSNELKAEPSRMAAIGKCEIAPGKRMSF